MTQEALLNALEQDAGLECDRILKEAALAAEEIVKTAEAAAAGYSSERLARLREDFARRKAAILNSAKTRMNSLRLEVMNSAVDEVFGEVRKKISSMPSSEYETMIRGLYTELNRVWSTDFGGASERSVIVSPADLGILKNIGFLVLPDPLIEHGVAIASIDGKIRYENTVELRLRRARQDLVPVLEKIIFD